jgi:hypothetical protein
MGTHSTRSACWKEPGLGGLAPGVAGLARPWTVGGRLRCRPQSDDYLRSASRALNSLTYCERTVSVVLALERAAAAPATRPLGL